MTIKNESEKAASLSFDDNQVSVPLLHSHFRIYAHNNTISNKKYLATLSDTKTEHSYTGIHVMGQNHIMICQ